jgi:hypothetical protein
LAAAEAAGAAGRAGRVKAAAIFSV